MMDEGSNRADESPAPPWHALPAEDVLARFATDEGGLSSAEAAERLARYGANRLTPAPPPSALKRFVRQFNNILIYVLLAAGGVTVALGQFVDAGVIFGVVLVNATIGFLQEGRAEKALDAIRKMLSPHATVRRDGQRESIAAEGLVPGDIVVLDAGDRVPADVRLIELKRLAIDEAVLTGESVPVDKNPSPVVADAVVGDRRSMAFAGTLVTSGAGIGVVVATGEATEVGGIGRMLGAVEGVQTPLMAQLTRFGRALTLAILVLTMFVFAVGVIVHGFALDAMFMAAVGLAVAAIPEGLPAIVTVALAIGVERMARRNAIIRRLPAVETLGAVDVICSDKTGTLTRNEMMVASIATTDALITVGGEGYRPEGEFRIDGQPVRPDACPGVAPLLRSALLCSDAALHADDGGWHIDGDPTEGALVVAAIKAGLDPATEAAAAPRLDVIPFDPDYQYMATLSRTDGGETMIHVKGAPERVLAMCSRQRTAGDGGTDAPLDTPFWRRVAEAIGRRGERLLAIAVKRLPGTAETLSAVDVDGRLTLLGLVGIVDPPRADALVAVSRCRAAGITVKMITGDHAHTARAIAAAFGIGADPHTPSAAAKRVDVLTGAELDRLDDKAFVEAADRVAVFARTTPRDKLRLVEALQGRRLTVAMTGDGVNDAPALKRADIGIAMGNRGTEAAKEAAEIVLADDNFASIAHAVEEGRTVYTNLQKAILYLLVTNGVQALTIIVAVMLGEDLPLTPVQVLWVNMVTAVTLAIALAFEPAEPDVMQKPPRPRDAPLVSPLLLSRIAFVSALMVVGIIGLFEWARGHSQSLPMARTIAVNALVAFEIVYLLSVRRGLGWALSPAAVKGITPALLAILLVSLLQLGFTYAPPLSGLFATTPLPLAAWGWIAAVAGGVFLVIEVEKAVLRLVARLRSR